MSHYLLQFTYTPQAWAALLREPADRGAAVDRLCQAHGGRLVDVYYSFSDVDGVVIIDVPDHAAACATALRPVAPSTVAAVSGARLPFGRGLRNRHLRDHALDAGDAAAQAGSGA